VVERARRNPSSPVVTAVTRYPSLPRLYLRSSRMSSSSSTAKMFSWAMSPLLPQFSELASSYDLPPPKIFLVQASSARPASKENFVDADANEDQAGDHPG